MSFDREALLRAGAAGAQGDPADFVVAADHFLARGELEPAASALDRAHALAPDDRHVLEQRRDVLERLTVIEHDLVFRYVPAGTFLMGSTSGDPDERPVHPVTLAAFWIAEVPMTWSTWCDLMGWQPPPSGEPPQVHEDDERMRGFHLHEANKIRRGYCLGADELFPVEPDEDADAWWKAEDDDEPYSEHGQIDEWRLRAPQRPTRPLAYDRKPMVAVGWADAEALAERMTSARSRFALPSEAQWEKAARGGLIGKRYAWGDSPPTPELCDFGHFGQFELADPRNLPANGYGLHGMCGGVWEWTATLYDALAYAHAVEGRDLAELEARPDARLLALNDHSARASVDPDLLDRPHLRVLRGGSWADGAAAVTTSVRMAREGWGWQSGLWSGSDTPNVGFRLIRLGSPP
ncbi:formylglycine-generating enzyme family protein [Nannocystaceae bacterium ST9]